ncbi:MAG: hypothetical protein ACREKJ_07115 [Candidatus Rokuibacteriota bacterium]
MPIRARVNLAFTLAVGVLLAIAAASYQSVTSLVETGARGYALTGEERILERLHGAQQYPGTGIGLVIVQKGASRPGGQAGVECEPGAGSRFWVELADAEAATA